MITDSFDNQTEAIIQPLKKAGAPQVDAIIITFSHIIEKYVTEHFDCIQIASLDSANGLIPIYQIDYKGKRIGFYKTYIGAPAAVGLIEEVLFEVDTNKIVMFGGAGCLDKNIASGKIMIPTQAYRDEGTSYHYAPAADYIALKNSLIVAEFMKRANIPYVLGKTWTTDAIYRETRDNFEKRKQEGCIAVEMECASVQAVCDFRGVQFYNFLKSGDLLDAPEWDKRSEFGNNGSQHDPGYFMIALELACFVS
ncbi:MAG: nucleoside phosphorylase [Eubacteriaceae bacterium]|nr:nucleoside phosphorylase [Eubacteriaceae bacterium]